MATDSIQVGLYDASNRLVTASSGGTVTLSSETGPAGGVLTCNASAAPAVLVSHGVATFTGCGVSAAGSAAYTLTATTSSPALPTASVTSTPGFRWAASVHRRSPSPPPPTLQWSSRTQARCSRSSAPTSPTGRLHDVRRFLAPEPGDLDQLDRRCRRCGGGKWLGEGIWNLVVTNPDHGAATSLTRWKTHRSEHGRRRNPRVKGARGP